jgi:hypothetical protein
VRYLPLLAKRVTATLIVAVLAFAPLAPSLRALSGEAAAMCSLHGRDCTCPDKCARKHESGHSHERADSAAAGPACHRPSAGVSDSKPQCQMKGCGKEEQATRAVHQPAEPAATDGDRLVPPLLADSAYFVADRVPIEAWLPPPLPPPRS